MEKNFHMNAELNLAVFELVKDSFAIYYYTGKEMELVMVPEWNETEPTVYKTMAEAKKAMDQIKSISFTEGDRYAIGNL